MDAIRTVGAFPRHVAGVLGVIGSVIFYIVAVNWLGFFLTSLIILTTSFSPVRSRTRTVDSDRGDRNVRHSFRVLQVAARAPAVGRVDQLRLVATMWEHLAQAFSMVFEPYTILVMVLASLFGLFVGAVPGLTATMATALLVPVTFFMPPIPAIAAIVTATAMAIFSGDIPGCLLRIPGTPASAAYTDEAFAMTRKGQAELALGAGLVFSAIGGLFGTVVLIVRSARAGRHRAALQLVRILLAGDCSG